jgi:hypothetical protein
VIYHKIALLLFRLGVYWWRGFPWYLLIVEALSHGRTSACNHNLLRRTQNGLVSPSFALKAIQLMHMSNTAFIYES